MNFEKHHLSDVKDMKKKVLIVGAFPPPERRVFGGVASACKGLIESSFSTQFGLILIDSSQISNPAPNLLIRLILAIQRFTKYYTSLIKEKPDCILIFTSSGAGLLEKGLMSHIARFHKTPVLLFPRGGNVLKNYDSSFTSRLNARFAFRTPNKILCQGKQWQDFMLTKLERSISDLPVIPNWTAHNELIKIGEERSLKNEEKPTEILFVGWIEKEKGVIDLLEAHAYLCNYFNIKLEFVGDGSYLDIAKKFALEKKIQETVNFRGWLQGDRLLNAYKTADIFILPSWLEGLPNSMIEAMAAKLPVIATSVGNIPSVIDNGVNGILIPEKSPDKLRLAIESLLLNFDLKVRLSKKGHEDAKNKFSIEYSLPKLTNAINQAIQNKPHEKSKNLP